MYSLPGEGWGKGKSWCYAVLRTYKDLPGNELDVTGNRLSCAQLGLLTGQKQPAAGRRLLITRHPAVGTPGFLERPVRGLRQPGLELGWSANQPL